MSRALADTSVFIAQESGRRLDQITLPEQISVSVITVGELRTGVLTALTADTREQRLATLERVLSLDPVPIDRSVADSWARLRIMLRDSSQKMPVNDSWIAATAMALGVPVITQDDDYVSLPGLEVLKV